MVERGDLEVFWEDVGVAVEREDVVHLSLQGNLLLEELRARVSVDSSRVDGRGDPSTSGNILRRGFRD